MYEEELNMPFFGDHFWLGMRYTSGAFIWTEGYPMCLTKWAASHVDSPAQTCAQQTLIGSDTRWNGSGCAPDAFVVCAPPR